MNFRTEVDIPKSDLMIDHTKMIMLFGSCFSENIGRKLQQFKFKVDVNPFGILYNPSSISIALTRLLTATPFCENDLVLNNGIYHSLMHHGHFSDPNPKSCLLKINERFEYASENIKQTNIFPITFGSAYVFKWKESGDIVGNCHKLPAHLFQRYRLSVDEITEDWEGLIRRLSSINPDVKLLFTVSPIRHCKEGMHENQLSKSILHLAIDNLQRLFPKNVCYFPAYEVMIDELRDYRFYEDDMIHPSFVAIAYIWQLFGNAFFSDETKKINDTLGRLCKALEHRPLYPGTKAHDLFVKDTLNKLEQFSQKYPEISLDVEKRKWLDEKCV